jgi:hypothetical protein
MERDNSHTYPGKGRLKPDDEEMHAAYLCENLGKGKRRKCLKSYLTGTNLVLLIPEVAEAVPAEKAVNDAL